MKAKDTLQKVMKAIESSMYKELNNAMKKHATSSDIGRSYSAMKHITESYIHSLNVLSHVLVDIKSRGLSLDGIDPYDLLNTFYSNGNASLQACTNLYKSREFLMLSDGLTDETRQSIAKIKEIAEARLQDPEVRQRYYFENLIEKLDNFQNNFMGDFLEKEKKTLLEEMHNTSYCEDYRMKQIEHKDNSYKKSFLDEIEPLVSNPSVKFIELMNDRYINKKYIGSDLYLDEIISDTEQKYKDSPSHLVAKAPGLVHVTKLIQDVSERLDDFRNETMGKTEGGVFTLSKTDNYLTSITDPVKAKDSTVSDWYAFYINKKANLILCHISKDSLLTAWDSMDSDEIYQMNIFSKLKDPDSEKARINGMLSDLIVLFDERLENDIRARKKAQQRNATSEKEM